MHYHHGQAYLPDFKMLTLDKEQIPAYPALGDIYRFILRAVKGDAAAAKAMFEQYLAGELSEELLTLSRQYVEDDRAGKRISAGCEGGGSDAFTGVP